MIYKVFPLPETMSFKTSSIYWFYLLNLLIFPTGFLIRLLYTRTISVEEVGIIYGLIAFFSFFMLFTNIGLSETLRKSIPPFLVKKQYSNIRNVFYYTLIIQLTLTSIFTVIFYASSNFLVTHYFKNESILIFFYIFLIFFVSLNLFTSISDVFVAYKLNMYYQTKYLIQLLIILVGSFTAYLAAFNPLAIWYAASWAASSIIVFIIYLFILFKKFPYLRTFPTYKPKLLKSHLHYSFFIFLGGIGMVVLTQSDILIITYFLNMEYVAYYSNAFALIAVFVSFFTSISVIFMPLFSEMKAKKELPTLRAIVSLLYTLVFFFILPFSLIFFLFPEQILSLVFGATYAPGAAVLALFSLFIMLNIIATYNLTFMSGLGLAKHFPRFVIPIAIGNIIISIVLITRIGLMGVVIATIFGWVLLTIYSSYYVIKEIKLIVPYKQIAKILLLAVLFILSTLLLKPLVPQTFLSHAILLVVLIILYFVAGYMSRIFTLNDLYVFIPEQFRAFVKKYHTSYFSYLK